MTNERPNPFPASPASLTPEAEARERRIEEFLAGSLQGEALRAFERDVESNPTLAAAIESQLRMDGALKRMYTAPAVPSLESISSGTESQSKAPVAAKIGPRERWMRLALAAVILLSIGIGIRQWSNMLNPPSPVIPPGKMYTQLVNTGWTPEVVCKSDSEFVALVRGRLGQGLSAAPSPAVKLVGWGYANKYTGSPLSDEMMTLLADVEGEHVLLLIDKWSHRRQLKCKQDSPEGVKLHIFNRQVDDLIIYEITPRDTEVVLPLLSNPDHK